MNPIQAPSFFFYHCVLTEPRQALIELLKKTLEMSKKAVIHSAVPPERHSLSDYLWSTDENYILPHGCQEDDFQSAHPILITEYFDNIHKADYLFFINQFEMADFHSFERVILMFDGHNHDIVTLMRNTWKVLHKKSYILNYYQQSENGWQKNN